MKKLPPLFSLCLCASVLPLAAADAQPKPNFKIIYNNDTTNILSSVSPFNKDGKQFTEEKIIASVDETIDCGGVDVLMMATGMGWDPWWQSKALPMQEHVKWQQQRKSRGPNAYQKYVLGGGDLVDTFAARAHERKQVVFATFRMNDGHHYFGAARIEDPDKRMQAMAVTQFFDENPQFRLGPEADPDARTQYALDFAHPEVRAYRMQFIKELAQKDIDGIELDFMRFWMIFHPFRTTSQERADIITDFVREVRAEFDKHAKPGQRRYLCLRVPSQRAVMDRVGIDPVRLSTEAGVDMFNVSGHFYSNLQTEAAQIKKLLPDNVAVYAEQHFINAKMNYKVAVGVTPEGKHFVYAPGTAPKGAKISWIYRRTTDQALITAAHMAYVRGVDGLSFFNFQYYRSTLNPTDGHGGIFEPPFHLFKLLRDPAYVAKQDQYYFLAHTHNEPAHSDRPFQNEFVTQIPQTQWLDMSPPVGGWKRDGRLRIQSIDDLTGTDWSISINGTTLEPIADVSEPYKNPYDTALGEPKNYKAFRVPANILKDGLNNITVVLEKGPRTPLFYLDIALPAGE